MIVRATTKEITKKVTKKKPAEKTRPKESLARPWNVIVGDDPVTLMTYVTKVLMQVFGYSLEKANRLMLEVHKKGRSIVWTGAREQAEVYAQKLQAHHLLASIDEAQ